MACSTIGRSGSEETLGDASLCSVCFEKFKSPRTLPCRHSFCHVCLSSAIESSCKEKEAPAGFRCPLCREFTPGVGEQKKWVNQFPINDDLVNILEISKSKLCGACKIENEENPGVNYCFECQEAMCESCTKSHRKIASSRSHTVCPLNEAIDADLHPNIYKTCQEHPDKPVEFVCNDHEQLCCTLCIGTSHRKCNSVDTLDVAAGKIKDSGMMKSLDENMKEYEQKLLKTKRSMEENMDNLDDEADILTKEIEKMEEDLIAHVRKAKGVALEKLAKTTKTSKEKINKSTESVDDQIQCIKKCQQTLADIDTTSDMVQQVVVFFRTKQINQNLQKSNIKNKVMTSKVKKGYLMNKNGHMIRSYGVQRKVECVIVNKHQHMVYSNYIKHTVSAMNTSSEILWTYESPDLRFPYGIEHDSRDNIYIAGRDSNNIHVLSSEGVLLRLFDNIEQPWFIAIPPDDDSTCCICSNKSDMTIYRIG
uniref:E3 ubiquitin-protein ligase TRIM56-like n=1 Tax=Crassostrea virginica TaxID=6565 RepID=A0A8B8BD17_CRAVI|nr:E3 ubiquitin-protein ligase TRIM56-like [Crassostrea virginica]